MNIEERKYKNRNPFETPEGYFQNFHDNMMKNIHRANDTEAKPRKKDIRFAVFKQWSYAAIITIALLLGGITIYTSTKEAPYNDIASTVDYSIDELIDNYPIDDYTFYCYLTNNDINY